MRRRALLARIGGVTVAGAAAGCLDDGVAPGSGGDDSDGGDADGGSETDGSDGDGNETDGVDDEGTESSGGDGDEGSDGTGDGEDESDDEANTESDTFDGGRYSIRTTETACGEVDEATVEVEDEAVVVAGQIVAPDPCHDAVLSRTEYVSDGTELELYVGVESTGGVCQQCLGVVSYEGTFEFEAEVPATVSVWHESVDTTREVARTSAE